ncbi:MAG: DHA2 family efflux MFS transporter permease subunit [Propionibacteriales bacterium]|nr:DHA2 family efflux MFS transporter permease subunit [Propionibacteriales bacterium]
MSPAESRSAVAEPAPLASARGRWLLAATVLGSGMAFLDGTVVNVALPAIGRDLGGGLSTQQWVLDGYLLTLSALLLLGGALGDRYGHRRIFTIGLVSFTVASLGCGIASTGETLIVARLVQGVGAAALVPGSLALINSLIVEEDRGRAVGLWAGISGVTTALGPFVGGWLVDAASWRWVFLINLPLAAVAVYIVSRHVSATRASGVDEPLDLAGAAAITVGLGGLIYALIEIPTRGWTSLTTSAIIVGGVALISFPWLEIRSRAPLLPMSLFRSAQFTGANVTTLAVYAALGGGLFLLTLQLQQTLGYSALESGVATLPITILLLLLSPRVGVLAQRTGPRLPMTLGPLITAVGMALMARAVPGATYLMDVLPGVLVFGIGLSITVSPLTSTVLASVPEENVGAASGANNAVSRIASLLAVAVLPLAAGIDAAPGEPLGPGFERAMLISAALCAAGGLASALSIRRATPVRPSVLPGVNHACQDPCTREPEASQAA